MHLTFIYLTINLDFMALSGRTNILWLCTRYYENNHSLIFTVLWNVCSASYVINVNLFALKMSE